MKLENILIGNDGRIRLSDFGLSHLGAIGNSKMFFYLDLDFSSDVLKPAHIKKRSKSTSSPVLGSPDYIAPDSFLGFEDSPAVDHWSLGVIFYEVKALQIHLF